MALVGDVDQVGSMMVAVTRVRRPTIATSMHYTCLCEVLWHLVLVCVSCPSINVEQGIQAGTFRQCTVVSTAYVVLTTFCQLMSSGSLHLPFYVIWSEQPILYLRQYCAGYYVSYAAM